MTDKRPPSDSKPRVKTYRKTKWFYGILLTYYAVTISAGAWWWSYSHKLYNQAVDPVIARGEPLAWSDFAVAPIPDDQNAAILYQQGMESFPFSEGPGPDDSTAPDALQARASLLLDLAGADELLIHVR